MATEVRNSLCKALPTLYCFKGSLAGQRCREVERFSFKKNPKQNKNNNRPEHHNFDRPKKREIIIIIIAFKGAIVQITCNTSSALSCASVMLRATWYEGTAQLLSLTELKSHLFELYFVG